MHCIFVITLCCLAYGVSSLIPQCIKYCPDDPPECSEPLRRMYRDYQGQFCEMCPQCKVFDDDVPTDENGCPLIPCRAIELLCPAKVFFSYNNLLCQDCDTELCYE